MSGGGERYRVLVVDDSMTKQRVLQELINDDEELEVVGVARNGEEAVSKTLTLRPDVITMDLYMPRMDGLEATRRIMSELPTPIVIISAAPKGQVEFATNALRYGALEFVPLSDDMERFRQDLLFKLKVAARVRVVRYLEPLRKEERAAPVTSQVRGAQIVVVGASTGGPTALFSLFSCLPAGFPLPILLVQHMTAGFTDGLAHWIDEASPLTVREANEEEVLRAGEVLICPGDRHMVLASRRTVQLLPVASSELYRPSVDRLFESAAQVFGAGVVAVVMTGMGRDGERGAVKIKEAGGHVIIQDEASCVVYGMPRACKEAGAADIELPLSVIPSYLARLAKQQAKG